MMNTKHYGPSVFHPLLRVMRAAELAPRETTSGAALDPSETAAAPARGSRELSCRSRTVAAARSRQRAIQNSRSSTVQMEGIQLDFRVQWWRGVDVAENRPPSRRGKKLASPRKKRTPCEKKARH